MTGALSAALSSARRIIGPDAAAIADAPTALMNVRRDDALPCACLMALAPEKGCLALARSRGRRTGAGILTATGGKRQYPAIPARGRAGSVCRWWRFVDRLRHLAWFNSTYFFHCSSVR